MAVHIFKVNAAFGSEQEACLCLTGVVSKLEVLEVQLAAHDVWDVVDDFTSDDVVISVDNILSALKETVEEMRELFNCLIFQAAHIFKFQSASSYEVFVLLAGRWLGHNDLRLIFRA